MAQDTQSTQPDNQALNVESSQPNVQVRDLDDGNEGTTKAPEEMITPETEEAVEEPVNDPSDDLRKQLEEVKKANEDLKKGLYDKGREMKQLKETLTSVAPESAQQIAENEDSEDAYREALEGLSERGVVTEEKLEAFAKKLEEKQEINDILRANPSIDPDVLDALRTKNSDLHVYDVIEKYKTTLLGDATLQKAHNRPIVGQPIAKEPQREKSIAEMSEDEFNLYLKKKTSGSGKNYI